MCCLVLCTAWYIWCWYITGSLLLFYHSVLCTTAYCLLLTDAACVQIIDHSALRTMWLSAPVLAYVPVDFWHWMYALPQLLYTRVGEWHCNGWLICGNHCTCSHGSVWLLLSSLDSLGSEESDHLNVLAGQATSNLVKHIPGTDTHAPKVWWTGKKIKRKKRRKLEVLWPIRTQISGTKSIYLLISRVPPCG